jgi:hypothetical protein
LRSALVCSLACAFLVGAFVSSGRSLFVLPLLAATDSTQQTLEMPGAGALRLPRAPRSREAYQRLFANAGFSCEIDDVYPNEQILRAKSGLRHAGKVPLAMVITSKCLPTN